MPTTEEEVQASRRPWHKEVSGSRRFMEGVLTERGFLAGVVDGAPRIVGASGNPPCGLRYLGKENNFRNRSLENISLCT